MIHAHQNFETSATPPCPANTKAACCRVYPASVMNGMKCANNDATTATPSANPTARSHRALVRTASPRV